jgi:hypothetical protein
MPEIIEYRLSGDVNLLPYGDVIFPSQYVNTYVLAAGVVQGITIPADARVAVFTSTNNFYVNWLSTATAPTGNITDGSASELNPVARDVTGYAAFSMVAPADCIVTIAYYA